MLEIFRYDTFLSMEKSFIFMFFSRNELKIYFRKVRVYLITKILPEQCVKLSTPSEIVLCGMVCNRWHTAPPHTTYASSFLRIQFAYSLADALRESTREMDTHTGTAIEREGDNSLRPQRVTCERTECLYVRNTHNSHRNEMKSSILLQSFELSGAIKQRHCFWTCCKIRFFFLFFVKLVHWKVCACTK